jgi:hypothetical protein
MSETFRLPADHDYAMWSLHDQQLTIHFGRPAGKQEGRWQRSARQNVPTISVTKAPGSKHSVAIHYGVSLTANWKSNNDPQPTN